MERVLAILPLVGVGCMVAALLVGVWRRAGPGSGPAGAEGPALVLVFQDCADGVEGLVRWLGWLQWWRDCPRPLWIGWEGGDEGRAILARLGREYAFRELPRAGERPALPAGPYDLIIISPSTGIPWDALQETLAKPSLSHRPAGRNCRSSG